MIDNGFVIEKPIFDVAHHRARLGYRLGDLSFTETLEFPRDRDVITSLAPAFNHLLDLTAAVLGVSYYKLKAPIDLDFRALSLTAPDVTFLQDLYENGLGEFYARNNLKRFDKLKFHLSAPLKKTTTPDLPDATLLPIGGGKDSLVSVQLLERAGLTFTPFAVNAKGPIITSVDKIGGKPLYVARTLDPEMIRLGKQPGFLNGHVPSTAINSMIAALSSLLFGFNRIILSNERSANEGNQEFDGREANHQYSKSLPFEKSIAGTLARATGGALQYFSLLRPYSEVRIAALFARETRFDEVFSSCNRNFLLHGHDGRRWCGDCPKCHFTFLIAAPAMTKERLLNIFGSDLLNQPENEAAYRALTGLAGQKPWECVGEILEAAACLWRLSNQKDWRNATIVTQLRQDLEAQYGAKTLDTAFTELMTDSTDHLMPTAFVKAVSAHAA